MDTGTTMVFPSISFSLSLRKKKLSLSESTGGNGRREGRSPSLGLTGHLIYIGAHTTSDAKVKRVNNYVLVLRSLAPGPAQNLVLSPCPLRIVLDGTIH